MRRVIPRLVRIAIAIAFAVLAIRALGREFAGLSWANVGAALEDISLPDGLAMLACTALAYCAVAAYDRFSLGYFRRSLSWRRSALSTTTSYAISNVLGMAAFTGNAIRYFLFSRWGLGAKDVAIAAIAGMIVCNVALAAMVGLTLLAVPDLMTGVIGLPAGWAGYAGGLLVLLAAAIVAAAVLAPRKILPTRLPLLRTGEHMPLHIVVCTIDYIATAAVLYIPLHESVGVGFLEFVAMFSVAKLLGVMSNIPGGLGVFEAVIASVLVDAETAGLAAALIAYRLVFFIVPFGVGIVALGVLNRRPPPPGEGDRVHDTMSQSEQT